MHKFPSELLDTTSLEDLLFMYRLHLVQPFGYRRDEFNTGLIVSSIYNSQRASSSAHIHTVEDHMPYAKTRTLDQINDSNLAILRQAACRQA